MDSGFLDQGPPLATSRCSTRRAAANRRRGRPRRTLEAGCGTGSAADRPSPCCLAAGTCAPATYERDAFEVRPTSRTAAGEDDAAELSQPAGRCAGAPHSWWQGSSTPHDLSRPRPSRQRGTCRARLQQGPRPSPPTEAAVRAQTTRSGTTIMAALRTNQRPSRSSRRERGAAGGRTVPTACASAVVSTLLCFDRPRSAPRDRVRGRRVQPLHRGRSEEAHRRIQVARQADVLLVEPRRSDHAVRCMIAYGVDGYACRPGRALTLSSRPTRRHQRAVLVRVRRRGGA